MTDYESVTYEGYGPNGTAIIVEALTDNRNRAASNIRNAFTKGGGNVGTPGCVSFMFDKKGQMIVAKEECDKDADELMMMALDAGAEDFNEEDDCYEITTAPDDFDAVNEALTNDGITFASAEVTMIPQTYVELTSEDDLKKCVVFLHFSMKKMMYRMYIIIGMSQIQMKNKKYNNSNFFAVY